MKQVGITPIYDSDTPANYKDTKENPLNKLVWQEIMKRGVQGGSSTEVAEALGRPAKSIAGRCTELHSLGLLRRTEAYRKGVVYVAVKEDA
jgi:hypothetical protein